MSRDARRRADFDLYVGALEVAWIDRPRPSLYLRFKARMVAAVFRLRLSTGWHAKPRPWFQLAWHGHYCGPGVHSTREPTDELDALCKVHDDSSGYRAR